MTNAVAIERVFFDVGGVLGTNGWDREQRRAAGTHFALDGDELDRRHHEVVAAWEEGRVTWDEYLDFAVFWAARPFSRDDFKEYVLGLSQPDPEAISVARTLAGTGRLRLYTLNNESADLNAHRIARFELRPIFHGFCSSCWLGARKPERAMYLRTLGIAGAAPHESVLIDDRERNLVPAARLGMHTVLFQGAASLRGSLAALGLLDPD